MLAVAIQAPFPHIAMHVVQTPRIAWVAPHGRGALEVRPLRGSIVGIVSVEVRVAAPEPITKGRGRCGAGPAGVFPSRLGWQLVRPSGRQPARGTLALGQPPAELLRV